MLKFTIEKEMLALILSEFLSPYKYMLKINDNEKTKILCNFN